MVSLVGLMNRDINSLFMPQNAGKGSNGASIQELAQTPVESLSLNPSLTGNKAYTVQIVVERISIQMSSRTESTTPVQDGVSPSDFSPEATAQRIFDFSIGLFDIYQAQHPEESEETSLANFEQLVQDAVEEGFAVLGLAQGARAHGATGRNAVLPHEVAAAFQRLDRLEGGGPADAA